MTPEQTQSFLADYQALCLKHGVQMDYLPGAGIYVRAATTAYIRAHVDEIMENTRIYEGRPEMTGPTPETKP